MKRFIFGFHRRVWWPKWTPASRSCRMETTAINMFLQSVAPLPQRRPMAATVERAQVMVVGVAAHPLVGRTMLAAQRAFRFWASSGPGMRLPVDGAQPLLADVRVHLRGGQAGVAEELLDDPQIGTPVEEMGGVGVPQGVGVGG